MEILGYTISSALVWIAIAVIFAIVEALTMGLTTIWFTFGGVAACLVAIAGGPVFLQVIVFLAASILLLYFTKPLAEKKLKVGTEKTNVEALPGQTALVVSSITPYNTGQVKAQGQIWTAVADITESTLEKGTTVRILRVEGVKLVVKPLKEHEKTEV